MRITRNILTGLFVVAGVALITPALAAQNRATQVNPAEEESLARKAKQIEANALRQVSAIETRLKQEEQRMSSRFDQLARMRDIALKQNDAAALKRVEALERQAVQQYEARIQQILKAYDAATQPGTNQPRRGQVPVLKSARTQPQVAAPSARAARNDKRSPRASTDKGRSRRLRLWPFST